MARLNVKNIKKQINDIAKNFQVGDSIEINGKLMTSIDVDNSDMQYGPRFIFDNGIKWTWNNIEANLVYQVLQLGNELIYNKKL